MAMPEQDKDVTIVVFRKWKKVEEPSMPLHDVIALFPEIPADYVGQLCQSFVWVGQHGGADYHAVISQTVPATKKDYTELKNYLEKERGYKFKVIQKALPKHHETRREEAKRIREHTPDAEKNPVVAPYVGAAAISGAAGGAAFALTSAYLQHRKRARKKSKGNPLFKKPVTEEALREREAKHFIKELTHALNKVRHYIRKARLDKAEEQFKEADFLRKEIVKLRPQNRRTLKKLRWLDEETEALKTHLYKIAQEETQLERTGKPSLTLKEYRMRHFLMNPRWRYDRDHFGKEWYDPKAAGMEITNQPEEMYGVTTGWLMRDLYGTWAEVKTPDGYFYWMTGLEEYYETPKEFLPEEEEPHPSVSREPTPVSWDKLSVKRRKFLVPMSRPKEARRKWKDIPEWEQAHLRRMTEKSTYDVKTLKNPARPGSKRPGRKRRPSMPPRRGLSEQMGRQRLRREKYGPKIGDRHGFAPPRANPVFMADERTTVFDQNKPVMSPRKYKGSYDAEKDIDQAVGRFLKTPMRKKPKKRPKRRK
jgi:hypothetical protein